MRETEKKTIDGGNYVCSMMPATKANRIFTEIIGLVGAPAFAMVSAAFAKDEVEDVHVEQLVASGLQVFLADLSPDQWDRIVFEMMDGVLVEGVGSLHDRGKFDQHFRGRVLTMWRVWAWAMEVNFRDFLDAVRSNDVAKGLAAKAREAATKAWTTQTRTPSSQNSSSIQEAGST
jgi:hypothetical protein